MNKLVLLLAILGLTHYCWAAFFWNHMPPKQEDLADLGLKCIPGRTVLRMPYGSNSNSNFDEDNEGVKAATNEKRDDDSDSIEHDDVPARDDKCKICVCSAEGKDEWCNVRPASTLNECIKISLIREQFENGDPYDHTRDLFQMIRRDLIWHRDEIPYEKNAKCYRGTSFYSNNPNANNTDIDQDDDVESQLGYSDKNVCFYCVCSVSGTDIGCISRSPYFCDYFRFLNRDEASMRDVYTSMFQQDRPTYFRTLAYRLRRTMDDGMYALVLNAGPAVDGPCVPYVSEYTDCNDENQCTGCTRCSCSSAGSWMCNKVHECPQEQAPIDDKVLNNAFNTILYEYKTSSKPVKKSEDQAPVSKKDDLVLDNPFDIEQKILELMRRKRAVTMTTSKNSNHTKTKDEDDNFNGTIKFYHTVDEINEDTLKHENITGTLPAAKVDLTNLLSRRSDPLHIDKFNTSDSSLQIEYSNANFHKNIDNKLDSNHSENGIDLLEQEKLGIVTNYTQREKDNDLSKIIVNELKTGTEVIGDIHAPIMSNITFTPENDTLTAMAFIAGNLLNKLWSMEKDSGDESMEIESMKNEKLQDLLELFKEPLTMRQEAFLKNALETLSRAIDKHKDNKNVSLCESIIDAKKFMDDSENMNWEKNDVPTLKPIEGKGVQSVVRKNSDLSEKQKNATVKAISKINSVLNLIKKYEAVNKHLNDLKRPNKEIKAPNKMLRKDASSKEIQPVVDSELNLFGKILEKITKLLLPYKGSKKISNKLKNLNVFSTKADKAKQKFKDLFNIDLGNTTLSARDKLILDYLLKINNPRVLMEDDGSNEVPTKYIEGDILLNLSEFFKIKSFVDLIKMLDLERGDNKILRSVLIESTTAFIASTTEAVTETQNSDAEKMTDEQSDLEKYESSSTKAPQNFASAKDKLKTHLKTILDDLIELQNEKGVHKGGELRIADALPCIYNILNADVEMNNSIVQDKSGDPYQMISKTFDELKAELKASSKQSRRMDIQEFKQFLKNTPKSAYVWERTVKNIDSQKKKTARRNTEIRAAVSYEELKKKMDAVETSSGANTYKTFSKIAEIPASEHLMLLRSLYTEVQRHFDVLKDIKASLELIDKLPAEKRGEIIEFVQNSGTSVTLDRKVLEGFQKAKNIKTILPNIITSKPVSAKIISKQKEPSRELGTNHYDKKMKLTRDEVLNQLIKNRVTLYMKRRQNNGVDYKNERNYKLAKNILTNLEHGNYLLARQMYKVFVTTKLDNSVNTVNNTNGKLENIPALATVPEVRSPPVPEVSQLRRQSILKKQPLIQFDDSGSFTNQILTARRDQMVRNLLNSKNFRLV